MAPVINKGKRHANDAAGTDGIMGLYGSSRVLTIFANHFRSATLPISLVGREIACGPQHGAAA